jgi:DNA-binding SARP family transcriptional activator
LGRSAKTGGKRRLHPLLKGFLARQLKGSADPEQLQRLHLAIGANSEETSWLTAAKHYKEAGALAHRLRVLEAAAPLVVATGTWWQMAGLTDDLAASEVPPSLQLVRARGLIAVGDVLAAIQGLELLDASLLTPSESALFRLAKAAAHHHLADAHSLANEVDALVLDPSTPEGIRPLANAWRLMLTANNGGPLDPAARALVELANSQRRLGLHYYAGVALHNAANVALAQGDLAQAQSLAEAAITELRSAADASGVIPSSMMVVANALMERGEIDSGLARADEAMTMRDARADAVAEGAYLHAVVGNGVAAERLLGRLRRLLASGPQELGAKSLGAFAEVAWMMCHGHHQRAWEVLARVDTMASPEMDVWTRTPTMRAIVSAALRETSARRLVDEALDAADRQGAWRWSPRAKIVRACVDRDQESLLAWLAEAGEASFLSIIEAADAIGQALDLIGPNIPPELERAMMLCPHRWLPVLRASIASPERPVAQAAAGLLVRFGRSDDAARIAAWERSGTRGGQRPKLAPVLLKRLSPTLRVHDLGRASYEVADRLILLSDTRRRAASLLLYLITRPGQAATREQVMDDLWPDLTPASAANSLHQTLYFLRRDIDPWYEERATAEYVRMESELVYLDPELVQVDSVSFHRQARETLRGEDVATHGASVISLYKGRFAPEFEYEPWAENWRDRLHSVFLHLANVTATGLLLANRHRDAISVLNGALAIDPSAMDIEVLLIRALHAAGSIDAATAQYRHHAVAHEREYGIAAPGLLELLSGVTHPAVPESVD